jgi:hypothetical protein
VQLKVVSSTSNAFAIFTGGPVTLTPGNTYYATVKPTTTTNVVVPYMDVSSAAHFDALWGGQSWHMASRVDAGAWSPTTTRRHFGGLIISGMHDATAAAGGASIIG